MTRVHTHQVELAVAWPSAALSDAMLATAMIAGLRQLYPELAAEFAEARVVTHSVLVGPAGLMERRANGAIARDGIRVDGVTSDGRPVPSPLQWDRPPQPAPKFLNGDGRAVPVEAAPPPGYRSDLVQPQPVPQDALGTPRILPAEAETLMRALSVRVEEMAVAVGWLLKQTASHTHVQATGRATLLAPLPRIEHR